MTTRTTSRSRRSTCRRPSRKRACTELSYQRHASCQWPIRSFVRLRSTPVSTTRRYTRCAAFAPCFCRGYEQKNSLQPSRAPSFQPSCRRCRSLGSRAFAPRFCRRRSTFLIMIAARTQSARKSTGIIRLCARRPMNLIIRYDRPTAIYSLTRSTLMTRPRSIASASRPCLSASAASPNKFAAPAVESRNIGIVVGRDLLEIVDSRDHLGGDRMTLRRHPQQHLQQFDDRRAVGIAARLLDLGQFRQIAGKSALYGRENVGAPFRSLETFRKRAQRSEALDGRRCMGRDVADRIVLHARDCAERRGIAPPARAMRRLPSAPPVPSACARASSAAPRRARGESRRSSAK